MSHPRPKPSPDPGRRTRDRRPGPSIGSWLLACAAGALLALALLADTGTTAWAGTVPPPWLSLARVVTALGNSTYMLVGSALLAFAAWWRARTAEQPAVRAALVRAIDSAVFFFVVIATSGLAAQVAKHVIGRPRPQVAAALGDVALHPLSLGNGFASFPSGHATSAFAAATALGLIVPRARLALFALAIAIGASRVVLREHYPSDVMGGAALGILVTLALVRAQATSHAMQGLRGWMTRGPTPAGAIGPRGRQGLARPLTAIGAVFARHGAAPALAAGLFAIAVPPTNLFGSEALENVKDGGAIVLALAGLTVRALVVGYGAARAADPGRPPALMTRGLYAFCRHPLYAGNILVFTGVMLMHGNRWTVLLGTTTYLLLHGLIVQAEEDHLLRTFGAAYAAYSRRVPRWLPRFNRPDGAPAEERPFDLRRVLSVEYPVIGTTIVALAAAELYEEIQEPWVGGQVLYLQGLATIILGVSLAMGLVWLARRRWLFGPQ